VLSESSKAIQAGRVYEWLSWVGADSAQLSRPIVHGVPKEFAGELLEDVRTRRSRSRRERSQVKTSFAVKGRGSPIEGRLFAKRGHAVRLPCGKVRLEVLDGDMTCANRSTESYGLRRLP
jgi:hypothetical protein